MTPPSELKPKCYFVGGDERGGIAFVELSRKDALKRRSKVANELDIDFFDVRVREVKDADVSGLAIGEVPNLGDYELIVRSGIYGHANGVQDTCPRCNKPNKYLHENDDGWYRADCEAKAAEAQSQAV